MDLRSRVEQKAKTGISNPELVTPELVDTALVEADELIGQKEVGDTVRVDIAYFRLILMIKKDGVDEIELELYDKAMKIVKAASTIEGTVLVPSRSVKVGKRKNSWQ